jgi:hypothetical protein
MPSGVYDRTKSRPRGRRDQSAGGADAGNVTKTKGEEEEEKEEGGKTDSRTNAVPIEIEDEEDEEELNDKVPTKSTRTPVQAPESVGDDTKECSLYEQVRLFLSSLFGLYEPLEPEDLIVAVRDKYLSLRGETTDLRSRVELLEDKIEELEASRNMLRDTIVGQAIMLTSLATKRKQQPT